MRAFKIGRSLEDVLEEMGGDDGDPRMQEMQSKMQQFQQQLEQRAQEYVQGMQEEAQKKIQQAEVKAFNAEKSLAITKATNEAKIIEAQIKGDIQVKAQQTKNELQVQLEAFKAQLDAILQIPEDRKQDFAQLAQAIDRALAEQKSETQVVVDNLAGQIVSTQAGLQDVMDYMKRPAKIIRDDRGRVSGAVRE